MPVTLKNCLALTAFFSALAIVPAYAQVVVGTTGQIQGIPAPASVTRTGVQSDMVIIAFQERQAIALAKPVSVNILLPGNYSVAKADTVGTIPAGTVVNSCMLSSNPVAPRATYDASITFKSDVLGIITGTRKLNKTDQLLGAPSTVYPTGDKERGLEQGKRRGIVILSPDRRTITVHFVTANAVDQIRIITAAN